MFDLSLLVGSLWFKIVKISFCTPPAQAVLSPFLSLSPFFFLFYMFINDVFCNVKEKTQFQSY